MVLAVWAVALVAGALLASGAIDQLRGTDLRIPGTGSDRAAALTEDRFGSTISIAILLKGPPAVLDERGPEIVRQLGKLEGVAVLSPFAVGGARTLRDPSNEALMTLQVSRPFQAIAKHTTPAVERVLDQQVNAPLSYDMTGLAPLVRALNDATVDSVKVGELVALPVLFLLLLLIFRSPLAALVPAACGLIVTVLGTAAMSLIGSQIAVDALALNVVTMIGLALGVDYSLLIVSRFREELANGRTVVGALEESMARAGRTIIFAGAALGIGMLGPLAVAPGGLLVSATLGVIVAAVLAVAAALFLIPASLAVLGTNINRWHFSSNGGTHPWVRISQRALLKPVLVSAVVLLPLLLLSSMALALDTGPPSVKNLPADSPARVSYEDFERDRGAGWSTPYEITFSTRGPITTAERLRVLRRFQDRVGKRPGVEAVLGPADLLERTKLLRGQTDQKEATKKLRSLADGLKRASKGSGALNQGLGAAADGSVLLADGARNASPQAQQLASGVRQASDGAQRIADGSRRAKRGADEIDANLGKLAASLREESSSSDSKLIAPLDRAQSTLQAALRRFATLSPAASADPGVQQIKQDIQATLSELSTLDTNVGDTASSLDVSATASRELSRGAGQLAAGLSKLAAGSVRLAGGTVQAANGADLLAGAFPQFSSGVGQLSTGLGQASDGIGKLDKGLRRLSKGVGQTRRQNDRQQAELRRNGISVDRASDSGYFVLAGIEGSQRDSQTNVSFALNSSRGGNTARVIVVPTVGAFDPRGGALTPFLQQATASAAREMDAIGRVGGPAVLLSDFDRETTNAVPWVILALVLLTFLVLLVAFRSPLLALIAVVLNLLTVGAAVGVLMLVFQSDNPLLGGPGYLDAIALSGIFGIIFGLSIDYEVFLVSRMLEGRALTGTTDGAVAYGLEKTTTIITGAAMIMAGVFLAFALAPVANIRQFGVGLTVAVILDATIIRLVLLPAMIHMIGDRVWDVPPWLDRMLPNWSVEPPAPEGQAL